MKLGSMCFGLFGNGAQGCEEGFDFVCAARDPAHRDAAFGTGLRAHLSGHFSNQPRFGCIGFADEAGETALQIAERIRPDTQLLAAGSLQVFCDEGGEIITQRTCTGQLQIAVAVPIERSAHRLGKGLAIRP